MNSTLLNKDTSNEDILTEKEAASYIRMSRSFLSKDRMNGYRDGIRQGPDFIKLGCRSIRYRKVDLNLWLTKNKVSRTLP